MKPTRVKFYVRQKVAGSEDTARVELEGMLVAFGMDSSQTGQGWSTGIIIMDDGKFMNIAVEYIALKEPFKAEDWSG